jgi:hypothetical protein
MSRWTPLMTKPRNCTAWDLAVSVVLLIPIIVIFSIPLTIGIGLDVFARVGEVPFTLALCAPLAIVLLHLSSPRVLTRHLAALTSRSGGLNYAVAPRTPR